MLFKIAIKNLLGARLRTWLNVFVTALSFFMIIFILLSYNLLYVDQIFLIEF